MSAQRAAEEVSFWIDPIGILKFENGKIDGMEVKEVPRISAEELKHKLDKGENVAILDVRTEHAYTSSSVRLPGALRKDPSKVREWLKELDPELEYVTY